MTTNDATAAIVQTINENGQAMRSLILQQINMATTAIVVAILFASWMWGH